MARTEFLPKTQSEALSDPRSRIEETLALMHRWGYAPTTGALSRQLLGGPIDPSSLRALLDRVGNAVVQHDEFVALRGFEHLLSPSMERVLSHRRLNGETLAIATSFASSLLRLCPLIDAILLSGSVADGGYRIGDDIDFDFFARDGSKYVVYAITLLLGAWFVLRHRRVYGFRKLICTNVVWTRDQAFPFERQDADMAFELMRCIPLFGSHYFGAVIERNEWATDYFPQLRRRTMESIISPPPNAIGWGILWLSRRPRLLALANVLARAASFAVYCGIHWIQHRDPAAQQRFEFLRRAKYPYEVFQD